MASLVLIWMLKRVVRWVLIWSLCGMLVRCVAGVVASLILALVLLISPPKVWVVPPTRIISFGVWIMGLPRCVLNVVGLFLITLYLCVHSCC